MRSALGWWPASLVQQLQRLCWIGGFCLLVELHWEGVWTCSLCSRLVFIKWYSKRYKSIEIKKEKGLESIGSGKKSTAGRDAPSAQSGWERSRAASIWSLPSLSSPLPSLPSYCWSWVSCGATCSSCCSCGSSCSSCSCLNQGISTVSGKMPEVSQTI